MEDKFVQLSNSVIKTPGGARYFIKVDSAETFRKAFFDDEARYEVSARDVEIKTIRGVNTYADGILITFCKEEKKSCRFIDVLISGVLGIFASDWY